MRVLVTGASSLIGQRLAEALVQSGDHPVCFQRSPVAPLSELFAAGAATEILGDIRSLPAVQAAAEGCDAVVHLAAKVGVVGTEAEFETINVGGTRHIVEACQHHGIGRLVHVSSPSVAHHGEPIIGGLATEPVTGRSNAHYPETKALAEKFALGAASSDLGVVALRPHLVWGPGDTQLVGRIVERARSGQLALVNGGRALVDTTYIDNAVTGLLAGLDSVNPKSQCSGQAYVISNEQPRPIRDLVMAILAAAGISDIEPRDVPLAVAAPAGDVIERVWRRRDGEPPLTRFVAEQLGTAHWFDPRPARNDLGYHPTVTIDEGITELATWFARGQVSSVTEQDLAPRAVRPVTDET